MLHLNHALPFTAAQLLTGLSHPIHVHDVFQICDTVNDLKPNIIPAHMHVLMVA